MATGSAEAGRRVHRRTANLFGDVTMTLNLLTDSTITFDQIEEIAVPITYGAGGVAVTINALVLVACQGDDAIFSNQSSSVLINNGSIFSGNKEGVDFLDAGGSIINNRG